MNQPKNYLVRRADRIVRLACDDQAWNRADVLSIDEYPWYTTGLKQDTTVAVLYDERAVYLLFVCEDKHIYAVETRPNGDVYKDSCVEFFIAFGPEGAATHLNFEANCCGTVHMGFGAGHGDRSLAPTEVLEAVSVKTSIPTPTKDESPADDGWWLAAAIPFAAISKMVGSDVAPKSGDTWRVNFYKCGNKTSHPHYGAWAPVDVPNFHTPRCFGTLIFGK